MSVAVIIPAAGSGTRFGGTMPKQYLPLRAMPVIARTIGVFAHIPEISAIVVAVNDVMSDYASQLIEDFYPRRVILTAGGSERQESIYKALQHPALEHADIVLVHDAVRPFVSTRLVRAVIDAATEHGAAVPALTPKETIKQLTREGFVEQTYNRAMLGSVQTPQGFQRQLLLDAYREAMLDKFTGTDDASLVEYIGYPVKVVPGEEDNIKITTQRDFQVAELILGER